MPERFFPSCERLSLVPGDRVSLLVTATPDRRPDHPRAVTGGYVIERGGEPAVPITDQEPEPPGPIAEIND